MVASEHPKLRTERHLIVGPQPRLQLLRRAPLWSNARRRLIGVLLALCALRVPFPPTAVSGLQVVVFVAGLLIWVTDLSRLFVSRERIEGMRFIRRELWIRAPAAPGEFPAILIDGQSVGDFRRTEVRIFGFAEDRSDDRFTRIRHNYTLAVAIDGRLYELDRSTDRDAIRKEAAILIGALGGDASHVTESNMGSLWMPEMVPALFNGVVGPIALLFGVAVLHLAPTDLRFTAIGVVALAGRISLGVMRLADATARQQALLPKRFLETAPARPLRWLTPGRGKATFFLVHALLACAVLSLWWRA